MFGTQVSHQQLSENNSLIMLYSSELIGSDSEGKGNIIKFVLTTGEVWIFGFVDCRKSSGRECYHTHPLVNLQHEPDNTRSSVNLQCKPDITQKIMKMLLCWVCSSTIMEISNQCDTLYPLDQHWQCFTASGLVEWRKQKWGPLENLNILIFCQRWPCVHSVDIDHFYFIITCIGIARIYGLKVQ